MFCSGCSSEGKSYKFHFEGTIMLDAWEEIGALRLALRKSLKLMSSRASEMSSCKIASRSSTKNFRCHY